MPILFPFSEGITRKWRAERVGTLLFLQKTFGLTPLFTTKHRTQRNAQRKQTDRPPSFPLFPPQTHANPRRQQPPRIKVHTLDAGRYALVVCMSPAVPCVSLLLYIHRDRS